MREELQGLLCVLLFAGLGFLPCATAAQEYGEIPERYLDRDRELKAAESLIASIPDAKSPEVADAALKLEGVSVTPEGTLTATLRNHGARAITAWSVGIVIGFSDGQSQAVSYTENNYYPSEPDGRFGTLQPGRTRPVQYRLGFTRTGQADYTVLDVAIKSVIFDDGEFAGSDLDEVRRVLYGRTLRAILLADMTARLDEALRTNALGSFLDESVRFYEASRETSELAGPPALVRQIKGRLNADWLSALRTSALESGVRPADLDDMSILKSDPQSLFSAAESTVQYLRGELSLLNSNLPRELRRGGLGR